MLSSKSRLGPVERIALLGELEAFRRTRIAAHLAHSGADGPQGTLPAFFFHVLPVGGLNDVLSLMPLPGHLQASNPFRHLLGWSHRFNADGYVVQHDGTDAEPPKHAQWFRFGGLEAYSRGLVNMPQEHSPFRDPVLVTSLLAEIVLRGVVDALAVLRSTLGVSAPLALSASFIGMERVYFAEHGGWLTAGKRVGRAEVLSPWVTTAEGEEPEVAVRAVADILWQSAGYRQAPSTVA